MNAGKRISDEAARSSEARLGVGTAVESKAVDENWGSAETGGEKALIVEVDRETDGRWLADVPSVPGIMAYGSTRADAAMNALILLDNAELGEPEKLNNAQCAKCGKPRLTSYTAVPSSMMRDVSAYFCTGSNCLAESSLSSPPHTEYCVFCGKHRSDELHNAEAGLLACSSFTADDYHNFYTPTPPETTRLSIEQAEDRAPKETR